jgi:hypothetical protein
MALIEVLDPTMEAPKKRTKLAPLLQRVDDRNVGFRIFWSRFDIFMRRFEELLRQRHKVGEIVKYYGHMGDIAGAKTDGAAEIMVGKHLDESERRALVKEFYDKSQWAVLGLAA